MKILTSLFQTLGGSCIFLCNRRFSCKKSANITPLIPDIVMYIVVIIYNNIIYKYSLRIHAIIGYLWSKMQNIMIVIYVLNDLANEIEIA